MIIKILHTLTNFAKGMTNKIPMCEKDGIARNTSIVAVVHRILKVGLPPNSHSNILSSTSAKMLRLATGLDRHTHHRAVTYLCCEKFEAPKEL